MPISVKSELDPMKFTGHMRYDNSMFYEYENNQDGPRRSSFRSLWQRINVMLAPLGAPVTTLIIAANVVMFLILTFTGGSENVYNLVRWGGCANVLVYYGGQLWRLFTCMFLHAGILHLVVNLFSLYNLGNLIERIFGSAKFTLIYLSSGLWGSIASTIFAPETAAVVSVGASGAIFGIAGAILYLGVRSPQFFKRVAGMRFILIILLNLYIGFTATQINNLAHIGGLIGGFLTSWAVGIPHDVPDTTCKVLRVFIPVVFIVCIASMIF